MTRRRLALVTLIGILATGLGSSDRTSISALADRAQTRAPLSEVTPSPNSERRSFTPSAAPSVSTESIVGASAKELALAMGIQESAVIAASLNGSDNLGVGVGTSHIGLSFPTEGDTFAILSTGLAQAAEWFNAEEDLSHELDGLDNSEGEDLVQLDLRLRVPVNMNCANVDFAYYTEEYPEWVGTEFNDTFTAEVGGTNLVIEGSEVIAPLNFAFDSEGNIMSVNTVSGVTPDSGTTYDGGTSLLRAQTPVVPGAIVEIVFSIQDLGDSIYDSAVFLDKFFWSSDSRCGDGAQEDTDGDGLLDIWETQGLTVDVNGVDVFVDLPAMGAHPLRKDIFVEIDYMEALPSCLPLVDYCFTGHSHMPKPAAMEKIIYSYSVAPVPNPDGSSGINLHVDFGPHSIMNPETSEKWESLSQSNALAHDELLGSKNLIGMYSWSDFKQIKKHNFSEARAPIFHYAVFAHSLGGLGSTSGLSRGIGASDFIVSLGSWSSVVGTVEEQAGTFMHELGHNVGLRHSGGWDLLDTNFKPNFLSVMNYAFQTRGLRVGGIDGLFDYSRWELPLLDEDNLDETVGLDAGTELTSYGTRYWCTVDKEKVVDSVGAIDWNCDGDTTDTGLQQNINEGPGWNHDTRFSNLHGHDDWGNLVFTGGAIGQPGADPILLEETEVNELTFEQDAALETQFGVSVTASGDATLMPNGTAIYTFTVNNLGTSNDTYTVTTESDAGWASLGSMPATVTLAAGANTDIPIVFNLPSPAVKGTVDRVLLTAKSQASPRLEDSGSVEVWVYHRVVLPVVVR